MTLCPGDRIEARCTRCHDTTGHVIIALVNGKIIKVVCQSCKSTHKYYPPKKLSINKEMKSLKNSKESVKEVNKSSTKNLSKSKKQKNMEEVVEIWQQAMNTHIGTPKLYNMNVTLLVGDIIEHALFGSGIVQEVHIPDKAEILFREGVKVLKCVV